MMPFVNILLISSDEENAQQIQRVVVRAGFALTRVVSQQDAWLVLHTEPPHVVIVDADLPHATAFSFMDGLRAEIRRDTKKMPKLLLIQKVHNQHAYKSKPKQLYGADDYLEMHRIEEQLVSKLMRWVEISG